MITIQPQIIQVLIFFVSLLLISGGMLPAKALVIFPPTIVIADTDVDECQNVDVFVTFQYALNQDDIEAGSVEVDIEIDYDAWGPDGAPLLTLTYTINVPAHTTPGRYIAGPILLGQIHPSTHDGWWTDPDFYAVVGGVESGHVEVEINGTPGNQPGRSSNANKVSKDIANVIPTELGGCLSVNTLNFIFNATSNLPTGPSMIDVVELTLTVPAGWPLPQSTAGTPGYTLISSTGAIGTVVFTGKTIIIPILQLSATDSIVVVYGSGSPVLVTPLTFGQNEFTITAANDVGEIEQGILPVVLLPLVNNLPLINSITPQGHIIDCLPIPVTMVTHVSGGTPPYIYSWSNGGTGSSITVNPDITTSYDVVVTDSNDCQVSTTGGGGATVTVVNRCGNGNSKSLICHVPSGNKQNPQTLCVNRNSLKNHLEPSFSTQAHGGDYCGPCSSNKKSTNLEGDVYSNLFYEIYPNPFSGSTTIEFILEEKTEVAVELFNLTGHRIKVIYEGFVESSNMISLVIDESDLTSGIYYCILKTEFGLFSKKLVLIK